MALFSFRRKKSPSPEEHTAALQDSIKAKLADYVPDSPVEDIQVSECDQSEIELHYNSFVNIAVTMAWQDKLTFPQFAQDAIMSGFSFGSGIVELSDDIIEELTFLRTLCLEQFATKHPTGSPWGTSPDAKHFSKRRVRAAVDFLGK